MIGVDRTLVVKDHERPARTRVEHLDHMNTPAADHGLTYSQPGDSRAVWTNDSHQARRLRASNLNPSRLELANRDSFT